MPAITVDNVSKKYRKGQQGYHTLREDLYELTGQLIHLRRGNRKRYEERHMWALRDVSFEVEQGERLGIIGANGCGKTTLLRLLAGITRPTEGSISLKGRMGVLIELVAGFHPELTGRENIYLNGAIMGMSRREIKRKFDEIVDFADVEAFIDTPIKRYSSGMNVRLGFAVAAHLDPDVLLIDEVLAVGDAEFQKKCLGKMGAAAQEGRTVLFVSHNMVSIKTLCSRAVLLRQGLLVEDGPADNVVGSYLTTSASVMHERVWDSPEEAPGNATAKLRSVRVLDHHGETTSDIQSHCPFDIEVEYWNLRDGAKLGATVVIYNQEGICVLSSLSNHEPAWHSRPHPTGLFRSVCPLPENLLPDNSYHVRALIWEDYYSLVCDVDQAVGFRIHESSGGARGDYLGGMAGIVRPLLQWTKVHVGT